MVVGLQDSQVERGPISTQKEQASNLMTTHRIALTAASRDRATMHYRGEVIGESREPLFAAARYLLAKGLASPEHRIETWRGKTMCLAGPVGRGGETDGRWRPLPAVSRGATR